jgi:hypothetical protein
MGPKEVEWKSVNWTHVAQEKGHVVGSCKMRGISLAEELSASQEGLRFTQLASKKCYTSDRRLAS